MDKKIIRVVAAVIRRDNFVLATQRGYGDYKDWWEFPGGKIEPGETPEAALTREIREELDTEIGVDEFLTLVEHDYPDFHLSMDCFWCHVVSGRLSLLEHEAAKWLPLDDLWQVNWLPADVKVVEAIEEAEKSRINTRIRALEYGLSFPDTYQEAPFHDENWQLVRYKGNKKAFLWTYEKDGYVNLNVKTDPEKAFFWRDIYRAVRPAYHQNKRHWITIVLDGSIPDKEVRLMIAESYDLIADSPAKRIYDAVKRIPFGRVATYAQIAELAGDRKMARAVGNALHKNPDPDSIPCFRVVNSKGELAGEFAFGGAWEQGKLLAAEGVEVTNGRVDLSKYQWDGR